MLRIRRVATKLQDARLEDTTLGKRCRTGRSFTRRETEADKHKPQSAPRARFATGAVSVAPRPRFTIASAQRSSQKTRWNTYIHIKQHEPPTESEHIDRAETNNCKTNSFKTRFEDRVFENKIDSPSSSDSLHHEASCRAQSQEHSEAGDGGVATFERSISSHSSKGIPTNSATSEPKTTVTRSCSSEHSQRAKSSGATHR